MIDLALAASLPRVFPRSRSPLTHILSLVLWITTNQTVSVENSGGFRGGFRGEEACSWCYAPGVAVVKVDGVPMTTAWLVT